MDPNGHTAITLLGKEWKIRIPDFATREELVVAAADLPPGVRRLRAYSAMLGLCTGIGAEAKADWTKHRFDALSYGGHVYSWLRDRKATTAEIVAAASPIFSLLVDALYPTEEVAARADFTAPAAD